MKMMIIEDVILCICTLIGTGLELLIIATYHRLSKKLSNQKRELVTKSLKLQNAG